MKYLNVDDLAPEQKVLKLKGKEYQMKEASVADFIEMTRDLEGKDTKKPETVSQQIEFLVVMVQKAFPTCPVEELNCLTLQQLTAIINFARDEMAPTEAAASETAVAEGGGKKKATA